MDNEKDNDAANRDASGRFGAGNNANPGGRTKLSAALRARALRAVEDHVIDAWIEECTAIDRIEMTDDGPVTVKDRGKNWMKCSELLAAYGLGKPVQPVAGTDIDGNDAPVSLTVKYVDPPK